MAIRPAARGEAEAWCRIRLSREDYEGGELGVIRGAFQQIYIAHNGPQGMAMLGTEEADGGYCVWFTPRSLPHARALVLAYSGVAEAPPPVRRLDLLWGNPADAVPVQREF
jgi:hypothetical protein